MRILVTVDTEADGQWDHGREIGVRNVQAWPPFQEMCGRHGVSPTYLITSEIAADAPAAAFLRPLAASGAVEVGAHLHPWTTPPYVDAPGLTFNDQVHAYPCQLDDELLRDKLETLTAAVASATGVRPTSFRAGRFGMDVRIARLLTGLGYLVDSSITPFLSWRDNPGLPGVGGPDFRHHRAYPFLIAGSGTPGLVEIPVTVLPTNPLTRRSIWLRNHWQARPLRALRRAFGLRPRPQPLWLRPRPEYGLAELQSVLVEADRLRLPYAVLMFHSSELLAGASPYRPAQDDVDALLRLLDDLFAWSRERGHTFGTLSAAGRALTAYDRLPAGEL